MLGTPTASHRQQHSEQGVAAHATTAACHLSARRHERLGVRQPLSGLFRVLLPPRDDDERPAGSRAGIRAAEILTEVRLTPFAQTFLRIHGVREADQVVCGRRAAHLQHLQHKRRDAEMRQEDDLAHRAGPDLQLHVDVSCVEGGAFCGCPVHRCKGQAATRTLRQVQDVGALRPQLKYCGPHPNQ